MDILDTKISFRGRRKGHTLSAPKKALLQTDYPTRQIPTDANALAAFVHHKSVYLEIGFGSGEHLLAQAKKHPDVQFLGCEPFVNGVIALLQKIDSEQTPINNIALYKDDARDILEMLPDESVDKVFLLFPDPWRKKRHHKRRFVNPQNLITINRILKKGGIFRFASDHEAYGAHALQHLLTMHNWRWQAQTPQDCFTPPADHSTTRYEAKARSKNIPCLFYDFKKE